MRNYLEDLKILADDEDDSEDELASVPKDMKTKAGYLKDGFVVEDGTDGENDDDDDDDNDDNDEDENEFIDMVGGQIMTDDDDDDDNDDDEDDNDSEDDSNGGSELDEDVYQYSSDENS